MIAVKWLKWLMNLVSQNYSTLFSVAEEQLHMEINVLDFLETFCQDWGYVFKNLTIIESLTLVGLNFWFIMAAASHL